ncbi:MAG: restriction endonuclease FokI C-terminal domain-containing protein [Clostridia bacterium]|uniref:restriction endonuclease FokI C-terminal domain-containing protein n=1 Tax=Candidatus Merdicola sp. TaxID=3085652 RepID=UPI002F9E1582
MIELRKMGNQNFRTFGWVQDPSDFESLIKVVSIFDNKSETHKELVNEKIDRLIEERDGKSHFLEVLNSIPLKIKYADLVGTSFIPRSSARCNGIVQATVKGQVRDFISDWPADNFVRWAQALGFIKYNYFDDSFEITEEGLNLTGAKTIEEKEDILIDSLLSYPPAVRILNLLSDGKVKTKFELGKNLGFIGEDGFTSIPQDVLIMTLATTEDTKERNKLRTDTEGSSDKYARMIAKWLSKLGLLVQVAKEVELNIGGKNYKEKIGQSYMITAKGIQSLNKVNGRSRHKRISKNISWEMLATKGTDRNYIRTRRALIIKSLIECKSGLTLEKIRDRLEIQTISELFTVVKDDIDGLINIGLNIEKIGEKYYFNDEINDFIIPIIENSEKSEFTQEKDNLREKLDTLSHEYLSLVDLAFDSQQNRLFEMKTVELLTKECNYKGVHLGGSRKPDGIIYTENSTDNYGVIIDTKAYSNGYNLPISQVDEMVRYVEENNKREKERNSNEWWKEFGDNINKFYFSFISGKFIGNIEEKLQRITIFTNVYGNAMTIITLLYLANEIKANRLKTMEVVKYFDNKVY